MKNFIYTLSLIIIRAREMIMHTKFCSENFKGREHMEGLRVGGR
jgi:hypothetical protein